MTPTQHSTEEFKEATGLIYDSTLPTEKVCTLLDIPVPTLTRWVKKGVIKPRVHGAKGRGMTHRFDYRQCLALAAIKIRQDSLRPLVVKGIAHVYASVSGTPHEDWQGFFSRMKADEESVAHGSREEKEERLKELLEERERQVNIGAYTPLREDEDEMLGRALVLSKKVIAEFGLFGYGK
jgi:DNA-binding transcriptional MerR regulator